jgi:hypothetical protein
VSAPLAYYNETGKGDHRHYGRREEAYVLESVEKLVADFESDCERLAGWIVEELGDQERGTSVMMRIKHEGKLLPGLPPIH